MALANTPVDTRKRTKRKNTNSPKDKGTFSQQMMFEAFCERSESDFMFTKSGQGPSKYSNRNSKA